MQNDMNDIVNVESIMKFTMGLIEQAYLKGLETGMKVKEDNK